ncbi:U6 small nuclear RNA (adenine-(43)-N(6))-methyltransferase [Dendroctonus ponderosae]|nr:U6 small nuclear RNA (adenine-(43)-N(6))-methyltransferase [Dendroctonus ponderosae]KAH1015063.1 hypothetical protein HUJ05_012845 [Dendroctonus ponderosae]
MSMNKFMHPRNIYKNPPNFKQLAVEFPEFKRHVRIDITGKVQFDFKDPEALRALSHTLLLKDFHLDVCIPVNKLVPTIPLRLNYILWIEDLLDFIGRIDHVEGIDIGTGASCVYPLIAAQKNQWSMLATEADTGSFEQAKQNIVSNGFQHLVKVVQVSKDIFLAGAVDADKVYDFCMCNPPFFASTQELHPFFKARTQNRPHPKNAFVASVHETVAKGGEVDFIQKMIAESTQLKTQIKLYTTMVGQKSSLPALKKCLREAKVHSFKVAEFCQGNTTRWGLAWTYLNHDLRKASEEAKIATKSYKQRGPLLYDLEGEQNTPENIVKITSMFLQLFKSLQMSCEDVSRNKLHPRYFVTASSNTWSHQRRKLRAKLRQGQLAESKTIDDPADSSAAKRSLDDLLCESTCKKLRLSTDSESSDHAFYKFMFAINCLNKKLILELNTLDNNVDREPLHQIMQFIKNNCRNLVN